MTTQPIRIGIIGCGNVLDAYLPPIEAMRGQGLVEVTMACALDEAKCRQALARHGVAHVTTDYRELVQSERVDLALILTPFREHGAMAGAALEAGKHVLVEKPMAVELDEARRLVNLATTSRGYLACAPFTLLSPTYQAIWRRLRRGDIGRVLTARARYGWSGPWWNPWVYQAGGGALFNLAPYAITTLTGWLGPARRVMAMTGIALPERDVPGGRLQAEVEDNAHILIDFGEGAMAVVTIGYTMQKYRCPAIELYGATGTLQMMGNDWAPEGYELWQNEAGAWQIFAESDPFWSWTEGLRHLVQSIRHDTRPLVTPEHAYHVTEIMVKAIESGRDGQTRNLDSAFEPPEFAREAEGAPAYTVHDPRRRT